MSSTTAETPAAPEQGIEVATTTPPAPHHTSQLTHQQTVWRDALEQCESSGKHGAINPSDLDGTPSYYSFQFKPSTFLAFGTHYGVLADDTTPAQLKAAMRDYPTEVRLIDAMILDGRHINWHQQFPDCSRKLGYPPLST